jgi:putative heme-binding domain-containing protein
MIRPGIVLAMLTLVFGSGATATAQEPEPIPHGQERPPGPALSPAEAIRKMTVPEGFTVERVASEPEIVNPVAMTFDERGRIWITESLEYPRREPGPGRDRVKVLEDTDGDGQADQFTVFAEALNIPSGIAVGHGGVWVANAPDILFLKDTDGDGQADTREVVATGFGRDDTHELPNSLTWGPDGWLYGWNGVFNPSVVRHRGKEYRFTCAIFRIHPQTRDFEIFCEGTSNPWGIAFDLDGSAFASACVIDHLWHLVETGYYHRQGGPYPPFTWPLGSIVDHQHQKAAYCGIHFFDSDAYPPQYRERLYMGNIHGNCINVDTFERSGATYKAHAAPDFLQANDAWFMPIVQKTGPDGCLYILDWYDRYHCYQDANRDPAGIDRLKGRLYRVRYKGTPRAPKFDLAKETDDQLIERLHSPNIFFRDLAQRLLVERNHPETRRKLETLVLDNQAPRKARMHALWALIGTGALEPEFHEKLLRHADPAYRAWGVRAAANMGPKLTARIRDRVVILTDDPSPDVQLQVVIAARRMAGVQPMAVLLDVLNHSGDDETIAHIAWQNLHPLLEGRGEVFALLVGQVPLNEAPNLVKILPRAINRLTVASTADAAAVPALVRLLISAERTDTARQVFVRLASQIQNGEIAGPRLDALRTHLGTILRKILDDQPRSALARAAAVLGACWKDPEALKVVRRDVAFPKLDESARVRALDALIFAGDPNLLEIVARILADRDGSPDFRGRVLAALGRLDDARVAAVVLAAYAQLEPDVQPKAIELLTNRPAWSRMLLDRIAAKEIPPSTLNVNQVRKLLQSKDTKLAQRVRQHWGTVREGRDPQREQVIAQVRELLYKIPGDPIAGQKVFQKVCAQCHKIYGEGQDVGPDITASGRNDFEQLLSNVFDPSLVIGSAYQATTLATNDGRVLTGLLVEDNDQHVILKMQGGQLETVARRDIDEMTVSPLSLMPEGLERQLTPRELADLFAFLCLDKPPSDPTARRVPGAPASKNDH